MTICRNSTSRNTGKYDLDRCHWREISLPRCPGRQVVGGLKSCCCLQMSLVCCVDSAWRSSLVADVMSAIVSPVVFSASSCSQLMRNSAIRTRSLRSNGVWSRHMSRTKNKKKNTARSDQAEQAYKIRWMRCFEMPHSPRRIPRRVRST